MPTRANGRKLNEPHSMESLAHVDGFRLPASKRFALLPEVVRTPALRDVRELFMRVDVAGSTAS